MAEPRLLIAYLLINSFLLNAQIIDVNNIEIVRDSFGVPHIYAKTDAELAYGLAWAHSEDDFETIQEAYLAGNSLLSKHIGLRGAPIDFLSQLIRSDDTIDSLYKTIDKNFIKVVQGYAKGLNSFADNHPEQVLVKKLFLLALLTQIMTVVLGQIFLRLVQKKQKIMKLILV